MQGNSRRPGGEADTGRCLRSLLRRRRLSLELDFTVHFRADLQVYGGMKVNSSWVVPAAEHPWRNYDQLITDE